MAENKNVLYLDDENFKSKVSKGVTLIDFYADWCGPCRMIAPLIEELASEFAGKANIAKLDIERSQAVTSDFNVTSIPTVVLVKDGKEVKRIVGLCDKNTLKQMVSNAL